LILSDRFVGPFALLLWPDNNGNYTETEGWWRRVMITAKRSEHFSLFVALIAISPLKGDETVTSVNNFKFMSTSGRISTSIYL